MPYDVGECRTVGSSSRKDSHTAVSGKVERYSLLYFVRHCGIAKDLQVAVGMNVHETRTEGEVRAVDDPGVSGNPEVLTDIKNRGIPDKEEQQP